MEKLLTNKLYWAILAQIIGGITAFFQLQGWVVWPDKPFLKSIYHPQKPDLKRFCVNVITNKDTRENSPVHRKFY